MPFSASRQFRCMCRSTWLTARGAHLTFTAGSLVTLCLAATSPLANAEPTKVAAAVPIVLPALPPIELKLVAKLEPGPAKENSGIVKSRSHEDLFWMHNDSGDEPRIYPIHRNGKNYTNERYPNEAGVLIGGAINVDWEDITVDADGNVIVADLGNNDNDRRDLVLYYLDEPSSTAGRTTFKKKIFVKYPDQHEFPAAKDRFNFDCEAVFTVGNTVHLLSKHRSDSRTTHYRLDHPQLESTNTLTKLADFDLHGQAVGADCSADGKRLVVISYEGIWLFKRDTEEQSFFDGHISWGPDGPEREIETVCFADEETLLLGDEELAELYEVPVKALTEIR